MTDTFNFDQIIPREGSSLKYDARQSLFGRQDVIPMWVADMDFAIHPAIHQAITERAKHPIYGYVDFPDSLYDAQVNWLKRHHDWGIARDWIMMCPGVVPSIHAAILAFSKPEEAVIVQPPVYFPFLSAVKNTGRQLIKNTLLLENGHYSIDFDHLEKRAKDARMLILCSPHNPVGRVWQQTELEQILSIAKQHDLIVLSDEIHADLVYPGQQHHSLAKLANNDDHIITAVAPSKTFNIPGLGLSALIVPNPSHRAALTKAFDTLHVSASNPFSMAAFEAAYNEGDAWLKALMAYLSQTRDFAAQYIREHLPDIQLIQPEGTYLLWLDCRNLKMTDHALKQFFVHKAGLGLSPGALFGEAGSGFMRMNIGAPKQVIAQALDNIKHALTEK